MDQREGDERRQRVEARTETNLILASASPRRAELLRQLGLRFQVQPADIDETIGKNESPEDYVRRLAVEKAEAISLVSEGVVLGADTVVVHRNQILGKPHNPQGAREMLRALSGTWHEVYTGTALVTDATRSSVTRTKVKFKAISDREVERYLETEEPFDKAGAYGIQGIGSLFVERIEGSYSNVMGLPLYETEALFLESGESVWTWRR